MSSSDRETSGTATGADSKTLNSNELVTSNSSEMQTDDDNFDETASATVKFLLMPNRRVATVRCLLKQTIDDIKNQCATELKLDKSAIALSFEGNTLAEFLTLADLGVNPNATVELHLHSTDPDNAPIRELPHHEYHMPDVITVKVTTDDGQCQDIVVEIERIQSKKPFLGGYRHRTTNVEYHHASIQTNPKPYTADGIDRRCRDTQTVEQGHILQQTTSDASTQMTRENVFMSTGQEKLVTPGNYVTADEAFDNIQTKVLIIQKYYRRWSACKRVKKLREERDARLLWEESEKLRKIREKEEQTKMEFLRRMNPKTREDFDLLYDALEKWRKEQLEIIDSTLTGAERKAALCQLLDQETELIASIGRHKIDADELNRLKQVNHFLRMASAPKKWRGPDGKTTEMYTPYTLRAKQLQDIYESIVMKHLTHDERLDALLSLKHTVKEHDCLLTRDIIELINREAELIERGVKDEHLEGLRKRISTLFLQYIRLPVFNPEAARLTKVPQDASRLRGNVQYCSGCDQYLPPTEFKLSTNAKTIGHCRKCSRKENDAMHRQDLSQYRAMLRNIYRTEETLNEDTSIAFLMQESDIRYLVDNIWMGQSALSACRDLYELCLVRWNKDEQWSPWNCILLTRDEAQSHDSFEDFSQVYGEEFVNLVRRKQTLARKYFGRLLGMNVTLRSSKSRSVGQLKATSAHA